MVEFGNGASLDFADDHGRPHRQHYAFLVSEEEFDQIHARIVGAGSRTGQTRSTGRRGGSTPTTAGAGSTERPGRPHNLEIITVPYGGA